MKAKNTIITLALIMTISLAMLMMLSACGNDASATPDSSITQAHDIGEGPVTFRFNVVDDEGNRHSWNVNTNETTVGAALVKVGLIEGYSSDFGLMVTHVNGIRAEFVEDGAWWAFYIDNEMAMAGVDATDIEEGVTYAFIYTEA